MSDDGGQAFPVPPGVYENEHGARFPTYGERGMSLRDWFAGQALAGLAPGIVQDMANGAPAAMSLKTIKNMPVIAYLMADAMLDARQTKLLSPEAVLAKAGALP